MSLSEQQEALLQGELGRLWRLRLQQAVEMARTLNDRSSNQTQSLADAADATESGADASELEEP